MAAPAVAAAVAQQQQQQQKKRGRSRRGLLKQLALIQVPMHYKYGRNHSFVGVTFVITSIYGRRGTSVGESV